MDLSFKEMCDYVKTNDRLIFDIETKKDVETSFDILRKINYKIKDQIVSITFTRKTPTPN
jgi:hypothetical protein